MILLGRVTNVEDDGGLKVRIPLLHKDKGANGSTPDYELPIATVTTIPGISPVYKVGDTLALSFDRDNFNEPVVVGKLLAASDTSVANANIASLTVTSSVGLPRDITIGDEKDSITFDNLLALKGTTSSISEAIKTINANHSTHVGDKNAHIVDKSLESIKSITLQSSMYGDAAAMQSMSRTEGQVFFLLEE